MPPEARKVCLPAALKAYQRWILAPKEKRLFFDPPFSFTFRGASFCGLLVPHFGKTQQKPNNTQPQSDTRVTDFFFLFLLSSAGHVSPLSLSSMERGVLRGVKWYLARGIGFCF